MANVRKFNVCHQQLGKAELQSFLNPVLVFEAWEAVAENKTHFDRPENLTENQRKKLGYLHGAWTDEDISKLDPWYKDKILGGKPGFKRINPAFVGAVKPGLSRNATTTNCLKNTGWFCENVAKLAKIT